MEQKKSL